jgi:CRP/FNR family cyclic AMP-dependent transcriptional regulator
MFATLTTDQASIVAAAIEKKRFKKNAFIVKQGETSDALHILLMGRAHVISEDSRGREVILSVMQQGDYVGEMSLIDDEPHSATVRAATESDVLILDREAFSRCLPDPYSMTHNILRNLVKRLRYANQQIQSLALMDIHGRIARILLEYAIDDGEGNLVIRDKISRQDMAKMVGSSREMVFRVMKTLEERGFLQTRANGSMFIREHIQTLL